MSYRITGCVTIDVEDCSDELAVRVDDCYDVEAIMDDNNITAEEMIEHLKDGDLVSMKLIDEFIAHSADRDDIRIIVGWCITRLTEDVQYWHNKTKEQGQKIADLKVVNSTSTTPTEITHQ
ncbi:MAG: hypothetical protein VW879_07640 [Opitutae bacterium]